MAFPKSGREALQDQLLRWQQNWIPIAAGDSDTTIPSTFILARGYFLGRVVVIGHDGLLSDTALGQFDTSRFMLNLMLWLNRLASEKRSPHLVMARFLTLET